jgi:predicted Rossmann fold flavoprotein
VSSYRADVVIVGGGAAGLAAGIFAARRGTGRSIAVLDVARKLGAKILISGGGRCNVTNRVVGAEDFRGGSPHTIRRILRAFPAQRAVEFFGALGVRLHEEEDGKLFPDTNRAQTVLDALLGEARRTGLHVMTGHGVTSIERRDGGFALHTSAGAWEAGRVVVATGGMSLPKTGSDGTGYRLVRALGHSLTAPVPALEPLALEGEFHRGLSGVSQPVELTLAAEGWKPTRVRGAMLWTHFGISGPAAMNVSGLWERARLERRAVAVAAHFVPGERTDTLEARFTAGRGATSVGGFVAGLVPQRVGEALLRRLQIDAGGRMDELTRAARRRIVEALTAWPLPVRAGRGYNFAEVTAGGVPLDEIHPASMESRVCPGLFLVGEILDADGRIGGFNFQWAWSTGFVAGSMI